MGDDEDMRGAAGATLDPEMVAKATVAIDRVIQKARDLNLPMDMIGKVMVDQGSKLVVETRGREIAALWLETTLNDVKAKGFETTGGHGTA